MERTNRPTRVGSKVPARGQASGVQQTAGGKQNGQWGDRLAGEYDHKMSSTQSDGPGGGQTFRDFRRRQLYGENDSFRRAEPASGGYGQPGIPDTDQISRYRREGLFGRGSGDTQQENFRGERTNGPGGRGGQNSRQREGSGPASRQDDRPGTGMQGRAQLSGGRDSLPDSGRGEAGVRQERQTARAAAQRQADSGTGNKSQRERRRVPESGRKAKTVGKAARGGQQRREARRESREERPQAVQERRPPGYRSSKRPGGGINFLVQGSILAAAGIVVRLIGMVYRIPLARKIGDVGNGYYNAAYSVYSILLIMSSYSLPTAVSKMVSARLAKGQYRTSTKIFRASMFYATIAGMAGFCALWFGAEYFAREVIKMPYSSYALKSLAPTIWIMAYLGVLRGYFQGHSTMIPTAVSQVFEQIVNAVVSIAAASVLFDVGVRSNLVFHDTEYSYAFGAAGGAIGTGAGALTALILFLLLTIAYVPTMKKQARRDRGFKVESYGAISRTLFVTIVPIIISSAIYNVSNVVDNSIFGHVMESAGEGSLTASQWGVYMGRYHMLFNIPVAIANSLSSSLIPSLSRAVAEKNRRQVLSKIGSAIRFSMIIAIPSAVGLTVLAGPVSNLLFSGMDNEMLIRMMAVGSSAVVFFSLSTVSNAILQGINRMKVPIINSAAALVIHVAVLYGMLTVFDLGIYSVVYANIVFAALVCVLNAVSIARYTRYRQEIVRTFLIPCVASAAMGAAAWGIHKECADVLGNGVSTGAAILAAILVYFVLLILLKGVDEQELKSMPGGTRLFRAARKLHLM